MFKIIYKIGFWALLCPLLLLVVCLVGHGDSGGNFIEVLPTGVIDWTQGVVAAKGVFLPEQAAAADAQCAEYAMMQARRAAVRNVLQTISTVRMDAGSLAADMMATDEKVGVRVAEMAEGARSVEKVQLMDGTLEITVQVTLLGGFAQLMLPEDIKQVEPIRPVQAPGGNMGRPAVIDRMEASNDPGIFTGLVVDARGIGAQPAMAPILVDESGKKVYGSAFISREYAVQRGVCAYVRALDDPTGHPRVGPKPLWVKGLRTRPESPCDIVISNADAARLRGASENLGFLRECRVIIILD